MTTIGDKFSALGTSIINLVGTRASKNMDNLSATGQANIAALAGGVPQSAIGNVCLSANPASTGTTANTDFTVTGSFVGLSPTSKDATTGAPINTKITLNNVSSVVDVATDEGGTSTQKLTMFINSSGSVIARKYVASYTEPAHVSSDLVWYDLNNNRLFTYESSKTEYAGFAIGEFLLTGTTVSNVVFYKSVQLLDAASLSSPSAIANVPTGTVISYMGTDVPEGFLLMDGRYLSKTAYANLYSVIGDTQTTTAREGYFQIADMTDGRYLMGSTVAGTSISQTLASQTVTVSGTTGKGSAHTHGIGTFKIVGKGGMWEGNTKNNSMSGAFYLDTSKQTYYGSAGDIDKDNYTMAFDSSRSGAHSGSFATEAAHTHSFSSSATIGSGEYTRPNSTSALVIIRY